MPKTLNTTSILAAQDALMATKPAVGYTQDPIGRRKVVDRLAQAWRPGTSSDCSFTAFAVQLVAGLVVPAWRTITLYSGNIISVLVGTGLYRKVPVSQYKTLDALTAALRPGDTLAGPGHVVSVGRGRWLSWEHDERGKETGGRPGWQAGEKTGWRAPYMRSRGWTAAARLIPVADFQAQILAAYAKGRTWARPLHLLGLRAPADVVLWRAFLDAVTRYTDGVQPDYRAPALDPAVAHAYVVLGGSVAQMRHRLTVALDGLVANPGSLVVVTGAKHREGKTEAAWMHDWLVAHGVAAERIIVEPKASSTVGNARYSLPLLIKAGVTSATVVSYDSHVRRAQVLFLAAQLAIETAGSGTHPTGIAWTVPLAFPDKQVAALKADAATRATIAAHTAAVLGITAQYQAAL